jgi:diadenosine tetraphosphate (Ap4A) HIT family hydrolase
MARDDVDCTICKMARRIPEERVVERGEHWVAHATNIPGWIMIATTRHGEWSWDMTPEEAETMGTIVAQASRAIRKVCDAERVYMVGLGENSSHFHFLLIPRLTTDTERLLDHSVHDTLNVLNATMADASEANATAANLRSSFRTQQ